MLAGNYRDAVIRRLDEYPIATRTVLLNTFRASHWRTVLATLDRLVVDGTVICGRRKGLAKPVDVYYLAKNEKVLSPFLGNVVKVAGTHPQARNDAGMDEVMA